MLKSNELPSDFQNIFSCAYASSNDAISFNFFFYCDIFFLASMNLKKDKNIKNLDWIAHYILVTRFKYKNSKSAKLNQKHN